MGFFDKLRGQFIDVIEWLDNSKDTIVYRFEREGNEIKYGAQLTVRESQVALFINEGQLADVFMPGRYELITQNMPIMTTLKSWKHGFDSPFKAEVYFINSRVFHDNKWGTRNPLRVRDPELGSMGINIRAFGSYAFKIMDAPRFLFDIVGTDGHFTTDEINEKLKSLIVKQFSDSIGESKIPFLDLAANYEELSSLVKKNLILDFDRYGIEITDFAVENISLPPEIEKMLDKRNEMEIMGRNMQGNLDNFTKFQMGNAMEESAKSGGSGSDAINMGMGFAMANQFSQQNQNPNQQQQGGAVPPPPPAAVQFHVYIDGKQMGPYPQATLQQMVQAGQIKRDTLVWKQGMAGWIAAGEVPETANLFGAVPPPPPPM